MIKITIFSLTPTAADATRPSTFTIAVIIKKERLVSASCSAIGEPSNNIFLVSFL